MYLCNEDWQDSLCLVFLMKEITWREYFVPTVTYTTLSVSFRYTYSFKKHIVRERLASMRPFSIGAYTFHHIGEGEMIG